MIPRSQFRLFCGLTFASGAVALASMYMRKLVEDKLFDQNICRLCIDLLQKHEQSVDILGAPLHFKRPNMQNTFNNVTDTNASIAILVSGSKTSGNLLIEASKNETEKEWALKSLTLKVPKQEVTIKDLK